MPTKYTTTDITLLNQLADRLLEPRLVPGPSVPVSTQWAASDWSNSLNDAQRDFLKVTGIVMDHLGFRGDSNSAISQTPGEEAFQLPGDTIDPVRVAWVALDTSNPAKVLSVNELPREEAWTLDHLESDWENNSGTPDAYDESLPAVPAIYLAHPPSDIGSVDLLRVAVAAALSNTGVQISVPDEFVPAIIFRALSTLLRKEGEAQDFERADYCESMYQLWIQMAQALMSMPFAIGAEG